MTSDASDSGQKPPRIGSLPREEWTDAARDVFAFWGEPNAREEGSKTTIIMTMANHPPLASVYNIFGKHFLTESTLPLRARELVVLRVSWLLKCEYEWHYHVGYAVKLNMTIDEIAAIKTGADAPNWNELDAAVLRSVDELLKDAQISDATWSVLSKHYGRPELMDLVFTIGHYVMTSWGIKSFGVPLEEGVNKIDFDLKTKSGSAPVARDKPGETENWTTNRGL